MKSLAPAGTLLGKVTARMVHLIEHYGEKLQILKEASYNKSQELATIEVYPAATLYKICNEEVSYKGKNWNKDEMWQLIEEWVKIDESVKEKIENDDDYDAVVCALSAFFVDKFGYIDDKNKLCSNRFIYIPTNIR